MNWKEAARRSMVGPKVELKAAGGELWIRPKKLSQAAVDAIREQRAVSVSSQEFQGSLRRARVLQERYPGLFTGEIDEAAIAAEDRGEILELYATLQAAPRAAAFRLQLLHGVGEHNFSDDAGMLVGDGKVLDDNTITGILEWGDLAAEMVAAIEAYNAPLVAASPATSPTSPSGSTRAPGSPLTPESFPTDETP